MIESVLGSVGAGAGVDVAALAASFGQVLHAGGLPVTPSRSARFAAALRIVCPTTTEELYWAARVAFLGDRLEIELFDRLFRSVFARIGDVSPNRGDPNAPPPILAQGEPVQGRRRPPRRTTDAPAVASPAAAERATALGSESEVDAEAERDSSAMMSAQEQLRSKDFGSWKADELEELRHLLDGVVLRPPTRRSRRLRRHAAGVRIDLRATLRASRRTHGDPYRLVRRRAGIRQRRVVLLADVSGSMEPYARAYVAFVHGLVRELSAEAFVFATRLTRLTRQLRVNDPGIALTRAMLATPDWSGGTRLGATLATFNTEWGRRGLARGAVVVIVSDGWSGDDPSLVEREMARLARLAHRIVWVNPRKQFAGYEPLVGAMAAALPFVDTFVSGHSIASLHEVAAAIAAG